MKIKILNEESNKIEFEIKNEDHTLCNAIRTTLWDLPEVNVAVYKIEHPAASNPIMLVETSKGNPRKTVLKATEKLQKDIKEFSVEIKKKC